MGEPLLCNRQIAANPYYIKVLSLNIYSLEELCYVIEQQVFLLENDFFDETFLSWVEDEQKDGALAERLRQSLKKEEGIIKFVELILSATGYLSREEIQQIIEKMKRMQHKSSLERRKIRADQYVINKKYRYALSEYQSMLLMEEECKKNPVLCGDIWHNQGTVFARLFLFEEAKMCFENAYQYHMKMESIYEAMAACRCMGAEQELLRLAKKYGIDEQERTGLERKWEASRYLSKENLPAENVPLAKVLKQWKETYRKNCG